MSPGPSFIGQMTLAETANYLGKPALTTITVLLLSFILALILSKRSSRSSLSAKATIPKCLRIQQIPAIVTKDELLRELINSTPSLRGPRSASPRLTLARSFGQYRTATFVSSESPKNLSYPIDTSFTGITPLFEQDGATIDIIAVHGLGSHAIGGFKSKDSSMVWLRDFLPEDVPNSRILVYGYASAVMDKNNKISITGIARMFLDSYKAFREATQTTRRPIIFIGHSLGGLVIKEALCLAYDGENDPENDDLFKSAYGLLFFGVPNLGIHLGKLKEITSNSLNGQLIHDLQLDSESEPTQYLRSLRDKFIACHKRQNPPMRILSYYEQRKTATVMLNKNGNLTRGGEHYFMVTEESACRIGFEDDTHNKHPLPSDHSNLVKFSSQADESYRRVQNKLKTLVEEGPETISRRFASYEGLSEAEKRHWDDLNIPGYQDFFENEQKLAKPVKGSLQWLLQKDEIEISSGNDSLQNKDFGAWRDDSELRLLLVVAPPGQGKSILSNFVVNHLKQFVGDCDGNKVIYFFCNVKDAYSRDACSVLRALIVQLCEDQRLFRRLPNRFRDPANDNNQKHSKNFHSAQLDQLWRTFNDLVLNSPYNWIYCVIDGLDVYETLMEDLAFKLNSMVTDSGHRIKLFLTSRPTGPLENFPPEMKRTFRPSQGDMEVFVQDQIEKLPGKFNYLKESIYNEVIYFAKDTFLWVHMVFRELRSLRYPTKESVKRVIKTLPQELNQLYVKLVRTALKEDHDVAILAWVAYSRTPISIEGLEASVAVMLTSGDSWSECQEEKALLTHSSIGANLGTLVDIIGNHVYLIHQSLLDFLRGNPFIWQEGEASLKIRQPNLELGKACLKGLSFCDLEATESDKYDDHYWIGKMEPFFFYASKHWYKHIEYAEDLKEDVDKLQYILQGPNKWVWLANLIQLRELDMRDDELGTALSKSLTGVSILTDSRWLARALIEKTLPNLSDEFTDFSLALAARVAPSVFVELLGNSSLPKLKVTELVVQQVLSNKTNGVELLEALFEKRNDEIQITPEMVITAVENTGVGERILEILLERRGGEIQITPEVIMAAAFGSVALEMLLEKRGGEIQVTPEVIFAAAKSEKGVESLDILLRRRGQEIHFTSEMLVAIAKHGSMEMMKMVLEERSDEIQITPDVVTAAAMSIGGEVLELLLEKRGDDFQITPEVVVAAAENEYGGYDILELLLVRRGNEVQITQEVLVAAVKNFEGRRLLELLLEKRGDEIRITPEVVLTAAEGFDGRTVDDLIRESLQESTGQLRLAGEDVRESMRGSQRRYALEYLLEKRGDEIHITPEVVLAASKGEGAMEVLLERRGSEIQITVELLMAATKGLRGRQVLEMLLDKRGSEIQITPQVLIAAMEGDKRDEVLQMLLERRGNEIQITPEVMAAAKESGLLGLLLRKKDRIKVQSEREAEVGTL